MSNRHDTTNPKVHNGNRHEISHSTLDGGDAAFRCIWLLATNHGLVSDGGRADCQPTIV